ncbi:hypothetical protein SKAU_G00248170 [Synaphobranchus kaupii]|uniref:Uncharacterized protein n=1 Tax=Synaphobranchus kaupii TaxID=118154 RepID=A0A9Q1IRM4_SYNKA|nr:hypothetical protein SKAU_G00248170 [Synaphobranchus kaupii]
MCSFTAVRPKRWLLTVTRVIDSACLRVPGRGSQTGCDHLGCFSCHAAVKTQAAGCAETHFKRPLQVTEHLESHSSSAVYCGQQRGEDRCESQPRPIPRRRPVTE